jgi:uncharacterized membrane protein (UPF0127 family)
LSKRALQTLLRHRPVNAYLEVHVPNSLCSDGSGARCVPGGQVVGLDRVIVETAKAERVFHVEVVREARERNRGLMFRQNLPDQGGMLFDYNPPQEVAFWMKNTYISLDIIFIDANGRIIRIAESTTPLSLEQIPSGGIARAVLEIKGGMSTKLGIKAGDRVRHALFDAAQ